MLIRFNVDPEERRSDAEVWSALEQAQLKGAITDLDETVAEGGANYSVGQRQVRQYMFQMINSSEIIIVVA